MILENEMKSQRKPKDCLGKSKDNIEKFKESTKENLRSNLRIKGKSKGSLKEIRRKTE